MNYLYVTGTLLPSELPDSASVPILDYSQTGPNGGPKGTVADLDEENLIEANGITASGEAAGFSALKGCEAGASGEQTRFDLIPKMNAPVDWDCDGPTAQTYEFDLNNSGQKGPLTTVPEWDRLKFAGGSVGGKFEVTGATLEPNEPLPAGILKATVPVLIGDSATPSVTIETVGHTETAATLRVRAADDHQLDSVALTVDGEPRTIRATGPVTGTAARTSRPSRTWCSSAPGNTWSPPSPSIARCTAPLGSSAACGSVHGLPPAIPCRRPACARVSGTAGSGSARPPAELRHARRARA